MCHYFLLRHHHHRRCHRCHRRRCHLVIYLFVNFFSCLDSLISVHFLLFVTSSFFSKFGQKCWSSIFSFWLKVDEIRSVGCFEESSLDEQAERFLMPHLAIVTRSFSLPDCLQERATYNLCFSTDHLQVGLLWSLTFTNCLAYTNHQLAASIIVSVILSLHQLGSSSGVLSVLLVDAKSTLVVMWGGSIARWLAYWLSDPAALGSNHS